MSVAPRDPSAGAGTPALPVRDGSHRARENG
jgi:hypothetical protein